MKRPMKAYAYASIPGFAVLGLLLAGCIEGSGVYAEETRWVDPFDRIVVHGALTLDARIDPSSSADPVAVQISGDDNLIGLVRIRRDDSGAVVFETSESMSPTMPLRVSITVDSLSRVEAFGASDVKISAAALLDVPVEEMHLKLGGASSADVELSFERLELEVSGSSDCQVNGRTEQLWSKVSEAGSLLARNLRASNATIEVSGASNASVCVVGTLDGTVSGASHVHVYCDPAAVSTEVSGASSVTRHQGE